MTPAFFVNPPRDLCTTFKAKPQGAIRMGRGSGFIVLAFGGSRCRDWGSESHRLCWLSLQISPHQMRTLLGETNKLNDP